MSAFDRAWALMKMPIVPGSVSRNYRAETKNDTKEYRGAFDDPISGERLDMEARFEPRKRLMGYINHPTPPVGSSSVRAGAKILPNDRGFYTHPDESGETDPGGSDPQWSASDVSVDDEYQKRGYGTGLYDFLSYILDRKKKQLIPSTDQTEGGKALWESAERGLEEDEKPIQQWRVMGGLG